MPSYGTTITVRLLSNRCPWLFHNGALMLLPQHRKDTAMNQTPPAASRRQEWRTFLLLTVVLIPLLSVLIVAGYGFSVWIWQILFGPPGHG